jgi:D-arabinose 1-dehydrogenase-like Zn-dependent alcohol dehydrogenase
LSLSLASGASVAAIGSVNPEIDPVTSAPVGKQLISLKIRKDMPLELAALIACGVITGYGAVVNTARVQAGETVAVIGCGGVGMATIKGAEIRGRRPHHRDRHQSRETAAGDQAWRHRHHRSQEWRRGAAGE